MEPFVSISDDVEIQVSDFQNKELVFSIYTFIEMPDSIIAIIDSENKKNNWVNR